MQIPVNRAQEIMGRNFFGVEAAQGHFRLALSDSQVATLEVVPFSEETLTAHRDTHVLVAVIPVSIDDIVSMHRQHFQGRSLEFLAAEVFQHEQAPLGWCLVRKEPVPGSTRKTYDAAREPLTEIERVPSATIAVYATIGHFLETGEHMFPEDLDARTDTFAISGERVVISEFDENGLDIHSHDDSDVAGDLGIASEIIPGS